MSPRRRSGRRRNKKILLSPPPCRVVHSITFPPFSRLMFYLPCSIQSQTLSSLSLSLSPLLPSFFPPPQCKEGGRKEKSPVFLLSPPFFFPVSSYTSVRCSEYCTAKGFRTCSKLSSSSRACMACCSKTGKKEVLPLFLFHAPISTRKELEGEIFEFSDRFGFLSLPSSPRGSDRFTLTKEEEEEEEEEERANCQPLN